MKSILTHQSAQYQGSDVIVIDGNKSVYCGSQEQVDALNLVKEVSRKENKKIIPGFCKAGGTSKMSVIFISNRNEIVFSSCFLTCDEKGRRISYDFYCDSMDNPAKVVRMFRDSCMIAGMELNPADAKTLESFLSFYSKRKVVYALTGGAAVIVLYLFCKIFF